MKQYTAKYFYGPSEITAEALVTQTPISFLGGVNYETGMIIDEHSDIFGSCLKDKILVYPFGKGSTGDTLRLWRCCYNHLGPVAVVNDIPDPIQIEGALMAEIGILFGFDEKPTQIFTTGDILHIKDGVITIQSRKGE